MLNSEAHLTLTKLFVDFSSSSQRCKSCPWKGGSKICSFNGKTLANSPEENPKYIKSMSQTQGLPAPLMKPANDTYSTRQNANL